MAAVVNSNFSFDDFELDVTRRLLLRRGEPLALKSKAFDLLLTLVESRGAVISKTELLDRVWENQFVEENNLTVHVAALRKALGESKNENRYIVTVPGKGYKFVGELNKDPIADLVVERRSVERIVIDEEIETTGHMESGSVRTNTVFPSSRTILFLAAIAVVLAAGFLGWRQWSSPKQQAFETTEVRRLTNHGEVNTAILSPDGKRFAYSQTEKGSARTELRVGQTDGNSDISLVPMSDKTFYPTRFSADGNWLYYVESEPRDFGNGTLYKIPALGGVPERLLSGVDIALAISPDERQFAFARNGRKDKPSAIVLANLDGTDERELAARPNGQSISRYSLSWSADSSLIAFGGTTGDREGFSSSEGEAESYEIFALDVGLDRVTQITKLNWNGIAALDWLNDGSGLLAVARDKDSFAASQVWHVEYPSGTARKAMDDLAHYGSVLNLSADSSAAVLAQINRESAIWLAPTNRPASATQITTGGLFRQDGWYGLDWLPDGRLVYSARIDQSLPLWIMNPDGSDRRQITPVGAQDRTPSATPDGRFVIFESNRSGRGEIWRVGVDGGDLTQITTDGGNSNPSVTPDSQWIVYLHVGDNERSIRRIAVIGGESVAITEENCNAARVSPDGASIACGYASDGEIKLAIFPIEGGEPVKLFELPETYNFDMAAIRWSPDGRFIDYRDWYNGIWRQPVDGGESKRIDDLPAEKFYQFAWSSDGSRVAFTRGRSIRDVVLIKDAGRR